MKKLLLFLLLLNFSFSFSQIDMLKSKIKSDSAISYYQKFQRAGTTEDKMKFINHAIEIEPDNYFIISSKSWVYYEDKNLVAYKNLLINLTEQFPNEGEAFYILGFYEEDQGELESANKNYEKALSKFRDDNILSEYNMQPFYKMMTLLLLNRKNDAKKLVDGFPEGKNKDAYILYHNVLSNIERSKLHDFIKNELK